MIYKGCNKGDIRISQYFVLTTF